MKKIITILFSCFFLFNCKKEISINSSEEFKDFLNNFSVNNDFQISRIKFPLKVEDFKTIEFELTQRTIAKQSYYPFRFKFNVIGEKESIDDFTQLITVKGNSATIEIEGIENGLVITYYFEKIDSKWFLVSWIDQST